MPTVTLKKIVDKFITGESKIFSQRNESLPVEYYASLVECSSLEDLVAAVHSYYDMKDDCQTFRYVLSVLDYEDEE